MTNSTPSILALFPGQGSQHVGMAKGLYEDFKVARETFEEASDAAHLNLKRLCFDGPESDLTLTENTQPSLLTASVAAFRVAQSELGFRPIAVAGHSLGEYSALVAAGALPLGAAAAWVRERGRAMQQAVPPGQGTMAAIMGLEDATVEQLCQVATALAQEKRRAETGEYTVECIVQPANFNAPGQVVIAGSGDAVAEALAIIRAGSGRSGEMSVECPGGRAIPLSVSAPFHCRLMGPARARMAELFAAAPAAHRPRALLCPYVPNRTARLTREPGLIFELLVDQVDHPVLWKQSMMALLEADDSLAVERDGPRSLAVERDGPRSLAVERDGPRSLAIEFGPGKVLQGLAKRISQAAGKTCTVLPFGDPAALKALEPLWRQTQP